MTIANYIQLRDTIVPKKSLGISRELMPQIASENRDDFFRFVLGNGRKISKEIVHTTSLIPSQSEFSRSKILSMIKSRNALALDLPIIISSDNYILDGHHRFLAKLHFNMKIAAFKIDMPILELIAMTKRYSKVFYNKV